MKTFQSKYFISMEACDSESSLREGSNSSTIHLQLGFIRCQHNVRRLIPDEKCLVCLIKNLSCKNTAGYHTGPVTLSSINTWWSPISERIGPRCAVVEVSTVGSWLPLNFSVRTYQSKTEAVSAQTETDDLDWAAKLDLSWSDLSWVAQNWTRSDSNAMKRIAMTSSADDLAIEVLQYSRDGLSQHSNN